MSSQSNGEDGSRPLQSELSPALPSFSLPPPPAIKSSITSNGSSNLLVSPLPPPPKIAFKPPASGSAKSSPSVSGLPPPPKIKPLPPRSGQHSVLEGQMKDLSLHSNVHSTEEQIPTLSSAPPSSNNLSNLDKVSAVDLSAAQPAINCPVENTPRATHSTFQAAIQSSNIPAAPSSSTSWTSFTQNASGFIEKAGRLAINTVESAADLASDYLLEDEGSQHHVQQQTYQQPPLEGQHQQSLQLGHEQFGLQQHGQMGQQQPLQPSQTNQQFQQQKQQFQQLDTQQFEQQPREQAFQTFNGPPQQLNIDMSSPAIPSTKTILHCTEFPSVSMEVTDTVTPIIAKTAINRRAYAAPPLTILAPRQSLLKVLIVPTADAQTIAAKNNTTLCEMFRIYGNSYNTDKESYRPPLPPFRSANRSMMLSWDNLTLDFISLQDMESRPVGESVAELALGESVISVSRD